MPFPNEHSLRLKSPSIFDPDTFRRTKDGTLFGGSLKVPTSISILWGKPKGSSAPDDPVIAQALRFDKSKWTTDAAKSWVTKNIKRGVFEPATSENTEKITDKDLVKAIIQGNLEEYNAGEVVPYEDIETMKSTIEFSETDEVDAISILTAQLHQLNAEDVTTDTTSTASESLLAEEANEAETQNLENIEIFQTGTWKDITYTNQDLDEIAANFVKLREQIKPPVKLGHNKEQKLLKDDPETNKDGWPSAGWITSLKRVGDKLVANISNVPRKIAMIVNNRGYARISSEIYTNLQDSQGTKHGKVLKAIAFLGGDIPHLKSLEDIVAQYDGSLLDNEYRSVIYMADDLKKDVVEEEATKEKEEEVIEETIEEESTEEEEVEETTEEKEKEEEVDDTKEDKKVEDEVEETADETSAMETQLADQAKMIKQLTEKDAIRDQVIANLQANAKAEKDEKNLLLDETFLSDLTKAGKFPPSQRPKALALLTELRTSEEKVVTYTEDGDDTPIKLSPFELIHKLFTDWPQGISFKETAKGSEIINPGSGQSSEVNKDGIPIYGVDIADKITKYMEEHDGVEYGEAYAIIDAEMKS